MSQYTALQEEIRNIESQGKEVSKFKKQRLEKLEKELEKALTHTRRFANMQ